MSTLIADLRVGLRFLSRDKAFTSTAALTLAVCIAANAALFSIVRGVVLKPLAIPEPERVVVAGNVYPGAGVNEPIGSAVPDYFDRLRGTTVFEEQALIRQLDRSIDQSGTPTRVEAMSVTPSFFRLVRVRPLLGRTFTEEESEPGNEQKVVLSYAFWQGQFGGDSTVVGRDIRIDGRPHLVVGVMPRGYRPMDKDTLLWLPLAFTAEEKSDERRHSNDSVYLARLEAGATIQQAQSQIDALNAANLDRFPQFKEVIVGPARRATDGGRRGVRVVDRLRQRRESRARTVACPAEGAGHALGAWRGNVAHRPSADGRAHAVDAGVGARRHRDRLRGASRIGDDQPAGSATRL